MSLYNVEKILDKRIIGKDIQYLVKWHNYPESDASWEPMKNLKNALLIVQEFETSEYFKNNPSTEQNKLASNGLVEDLTEEKKIKKK